MTCKFRKWLPINLLLIFSLQMTGAPVLLAQEAIAQGKRAMRADAILSANTQVQPVGTLSGTVAFVPPGNEIKPKYSQIRLEKSVRVPMRDGIRLSTDFYFPQGEKGPFPVIAIRLPYNKNYYRKPGSIAYFFAGQGYVVAIQDMRGKFESEGDYIISAADRNDGYDFLSWLSAQSWSTGNIGTYGCSYLGENQIQLAATRHPNHKAAIAQAAGGAYAGTHRQFMYRDGGVPELWNSLSWFWRHGSKVRTQLPGSLTDRQFSQLAEFFQTEPRAPELNLPEAARTLPVIDMMEKNGNPIPTDFREYLSSPPASAYWHKLNYVNDSDRFNVPVLHVNSWYDGSVDETLRLFNLFRRNSESTRAADNQFVIISPTAHCRSENTQPPFVIGERDLGDASFHYLETYLNWFDYWLKGEPNDILRRPKVQYYLMGENAWRTAPAWPVPNIEFVPFYLHGNGLANSKNGDGSLSIEPPRQERPDSFIYDPMDPVPSKGLCCNQPDGAYDQAAIETRKDVLVYTSEPLSNGLTIAGPLQLELFISSSAKDTDFTAKLVDVYPDGRAYNLQESILRARYRDGYDRPRMMRPDRVYKLPINLHATANYFKPGHRIRLEISSSNFPRYVRNLNTGGNNYDESIGVIAHNRVYHSRQYPSKLILPVAR